MRQMLLASVFSILSGCYASGLPVAADDCVPRTCAELMHTCGAVDDGCGKTIDCGRCEPTSTCVTFDGGASECR